MAELLEEFVLKQEQLRKSLIDFMLENSLTWSELSTDLDVNYITILKFLRHKRDISRKTMIKIDRYLLAKQAEKAGQKSL
jgi:hypothetical protein